MAFMSPSQWCQSTDNASEVTTLWCYTNVFVIIIIIRLLTVRMCQLCCSVTAILSVFLFVVGRRQHVVRACHGTACWQDAVFHVHCLYSLVCSHNPDSLGLLHPAARVHCSLPGGGVVNKEMIRLKGISMSQLKSNC